MTLQRNPKSGTWRLPEGYKDIDDYLKENSGDSLMFAAKNSKIIY